MPSRPLPILLLVLAAVASTACERLKDELFGQSAAALRYEADTLLMKSEPPLLFRVVPTENGGARIFPIAAGTGSGVQMLRLSDRAWREFDVAYFRSGKSIPIVREGRRAGELRILRGMWDPTVQASEAFEGCAIVIPAAIGLYSGGDNGELAVIRPDSLVRGVQPANVEQAIANINTLVAPSQGISMTELANYRRRAFSVPNRETGFESVVAIYDDPATLPPEKRTRPRQLIVVLDKSPYGYRPSFTFATKAGPTDEPAWRLLDWVDLTGDGTPELVFGLDMPEAKLSTIVVGYSAGEWRELMRRGEGRCDF